MSVPPLDLTLPNPLPWPAHTPPPSLPSNYYSSSFCPYAHIIIRILECDREQIFFYGRGPPTLFGVGKLKSCDKYGHPYVYKQVK